MNIAYNMDCMEYMQTLPDKAFDLAVVDPPYGIGITKSGRLKKYNANSRKWDDSTPKEEYFQELFRVSKNQIIWGGELFQLATDEMLFGLGQETTRRCFFCVLRVCVDKF